MKLKLDNNNPKYQVFLIRYNTSIQIQKLFCSLNSCLTYSFLILHPFIFFLSFFLADATLTAGFQAAIALTGAEFTSALSYLSKSWLPARALVLADLQARTQIDPSGQIMKLNSYCPWKEHLYQLEEELGIAGQVKYVLYEDEREKKWRIQAVGVAPGSFESRKALPVPWRGFRDDELSAVTGIPGGVFVHASGFIGGNATYEGALEMAKKALTME